MKRRDFIQSSCQVCIWGILGIGLDAIVGCVPTNAIYKTQAINKMISVPKVQMQGKVIQIIRIPEIDFDIALRVESNGSYKAFILACTHHENPLNVTGNGFICSLHGSQYDQEGNVKKGPASIPLKQYPAHILNDNIIIEIS